MPEELYVEERTGLVRKVKYLGSNGRGIVLSDEPYEPNGKCVFVNPQNNFLEEGEPINHPFERFIHGKNYRKTSDFRSNGNPVVFHPKRKELAEVKPRHEFGYYTKVRNLQIN